MGRPNKGQHKIPRIYLEAFADVGGKVWISDKDLRLTNREPEKVLTEKDYYTIRFDTGGGTLVVETQFLGGKSTLENLYIWKTPIYIKKMTTLYEERLCMMVSQTKNIRDAKEKAELSVFVASMMERQPISRKSLEKFFSDVSEKVEHLRSLPDEAKKRMSEIMPISDHDRRNSISADELLKVGEDVGSFHSSLIPDTVVGIAPIINDMKWCFMVREPSAVEFLTSDLCGQNSCGNDVYCLPSSQNIGVKILPIIEDMASNKLDANANGIGGEELVDIYEWAFSTNDKIDLTAPNIVAMDSISDASLKNPINVVFSKDLMSSSVNYDSVILEDNNGLINYWLSVLDGKIVRIHHDLFDPLSNYKPTLNSQIKDTLQNCWYICECSADPGETCYCSNNNVGTECPGGNCASDQ